MKLHLLSDVHLEFESFEPPETDADVIILAGDIHLGVKGLAWAMTQFAPKPVIYVLGNHEYYRHALPRLQEKLKQKAQGSNVHILENDALTIGATVFLGCTLWTDFRLLGDPGVAAFEAGQWMTDYRLIRLNPAYRRLSAADTAGFHAESKRWLQQQLAKHRDSRTVVVSHHAPSLRSIPRSFRENILSAAYASDLEELVMNSGASLWCHGHVHSQNDYHISATRVMSNPRGYPNERNPEFVPDLTIEI